MLLFAASHLCSSREPVSAVRHSPTLVIILLNQANWLKAAGVRRGDFVAIYMPMILELPYAMVGS